MINLALLILWALLLFGGMLAGRGNSSKTFRSPKWARLSSSLMLTLAAWWHLFESSHFSFQLRLFIALGMTFGFVGDLFMAQLILKQKNYVIGGMAAFGVGHLFYIFSGAQLLNEVNRWVILCEGIWILVALVLWFLLIFHPAKEKNLLHLLALPYAILLATTVSIFFSVALSTGSLNTTLVTMGAILFLLSDLLLAMQLFNKFHFNWIGDVVWFLYGIGQMLIVFGWVHVK